MTDLQQIIAELERQKSAIDNALAALREINSTPEPKRRGRPPGSGRRPGKSEPAPVSAVVQTGIAQRKRGRPPKKQVRLTEEGRQRLAESMKKRWAAKRAAKKATRKTERRL